MKNVDASANRDLAQIENELAEPAHYFRHVVNALQSLPVTSIESCVERLVQAYEMNRCVYVFGNGGSAALASHVACDLGKGTMASGRRPLRVQSLVDNVSVLTAWANDSSYEDVFAAQLKCLPIEPDDIAFAISGSGNSPNVIRALRFAREVGLSTLGLTGFRGGAMKKLCDVCIVVPSENMQQIEDCHLSIMHAVFLAVRHNLSVLNPVHSLGAFV
jgi:D-sedoheptulose 7-phosphate isomerase